MFTLFANIYNPSSILAFLTTLPTPNFNPIYLEKLDLVSFQKLFEPLVELQPDELGPPWGASLLVLDRWGPRAAGGPTLVHAGAVVVHVGVELHVAHHGHALALENLKYEHFKHFRKKKLLKQFTNIFMG